MAPTAHKSPFHGPRYTPRILRGESTRTVYDKYGQNILFYFVIDDHVHDEVRSDVCGDCQRKDGVVEYLPQNIMYLGLGGWIDT